VFTQIRVTTLHQEIYINQHPLTQVMVQLVQENRGAADVYMQLNNVSRTQMGITRGKRLSAKCDSDFVNAIIAGILVVQFAALADMSRQLEAGRPLHPGTSDADCLRALVPFAIYGRIKKVCTRHWIMYVIMISLLTSLVPMFRHWVQN
jgi:hypothetical protein